MFKVSVKAVQKQANKGWLHTIRTPGGQRRFSADQVDALLGITIQLPYGMTTDAREARS
jgi:DNA-binding transcriptional MerR regulator